MDQKAIVRASVRRTQAPRGRSNATGGRISWTVQFCTGIPVFSDPLGNTFNTRESRSSTSMR